MSGVIPQVAALMGPCAAGTAYIPGLADFVPMVKGRGSMALAGPHLTKAVTGEDVTQEELGGSKIHTRISGVGDLEVDSDEECIEAIKDYLSFFPSNCEEPPPIRETVRPGRPPGRGAARRAARVAAQALRHVRRDPPDRRRRRRTSTSSRASRARSSPASRGWAGGRSASSPTSRKHLGGILENDSADKAARFINLCDAYGIPLLFLQDVPGFMVGTKVERGGHHPPRREDALRGLARDRPEGHRGDPQGLRRRLLRDVRQGLRAGPDRRLAERGDLGDGPRGRGQHHLPQADRGGRGPGRHARGDDRGRSASRSTPTSPRATR